MEKIVFIIDDDKMYLAMMKNHFSQMGGYQVQSYFEGEEALKQLAVTDPFMIILDHHLTDPTKDGIYYLKQIKKLKPKIPTLYITSDSSPTIKKEVEKVGVKNVIIKSPSSLVQIRTAIDEIIEAKENSEKGIFEKLFNKTKKARWAVNFLSIFSAIQ